MKWLWQALVLTGLLALWAIAAALVATPALPAPWVALTTFARNLPGQLGVHLAVSTARVLVSLLAAFALGVPVGLCLGREERLDRVFAPLVYLVYPIPKIVLLPVVMIFLGLGNASKIFLIVLVLFFQVLVTTRDAARQIDDQVIASVRSLGAGRLDIYRHVVWPAALPEVLTGLRIATGTAIAVLFFAETVASETGLGYYLLDAWSRYAYPEMYAGMMAMGLLGYCLYAFLDLLERRLCPWRHVGRSGAVVPGVGPCTGLGETGRGSAKNSS